MIYVKNLKNLNQNKMMIISLYPYDDVYQVVSNDETIVYFQGTREECEKYRMKRLFFNF